MTLSVLDCGGTFTAPGRIGPAARARTVTPISTPLSGPWSFRRMPGGNGEATAHGADDWMPATVPGCVHTDLLANRKIGDPFYGQNERDQQWIDKEGWEYRTVIGADTALLSRQRVELVWKGLDTYADVRLNGRSILRTDNMFREWRVDVKALLHEGDNTLIVQLRSPIEEVKAAYDRLGYTLPAANDQATPMVSMFTRKAPYHYGWDWGPRFVTSGIWRPVLLESWDEARIGNVQVLQTALTDERAQLNVRTTVVATRAATAKVTISVAGTSAHAEVTASLAPGQNLLEATLVIEHPRRWWPNGLGEPHLYEVRTALSVDEAARDARTARVGLRTLEVVHRPDPLGKSFTIRVNGAPVFMKGANYIPSDSFPSRVTDERYRWLLRSAAQANMNMLRVWGGGIYEDDRFYDLCDELGILVWQDFMFACSMYPGDEDFVENVRREAIDNVERLRNHPSLALWAGNNEIEAAWAKWGWQRKFSLSDDAQLKIWGDYRRLFHELLPGIVAEHDPGRFYTRSSPSANDDAITPDSLGFGDMHYWGVWHAEEPYARYADHISRFMSEYGFQSFPELATVARYAAPADFEIDSPVMLAHQRHPRGNQLIRAYMERDFRAPKDFASFLYVSQVLQATIIQFAAEAHRRKMPYNGGSLYWQLDDCWPVASWSGIDYFGNWKALHYFARRFFAPILVSTAEEGGEVRVYVVSDRREDTAIRLFVRLIDFDGRELWRRESQGRAAANSSAVHMTVAGQELFGAGALAARAAGSARPDRTVLVAEAFDGSHLVGRSLHYFAPTKELALDDPGLELQAIPGDDQHTVVRIRARKLARGVRLSANSAEGTFSDNYFDILPGETRTIDWAGPRAKSFEAVSLRDTY